MPLAALIPMTTLAAVLLIVAANMADWTSFFRLCKTAPKSDVIVLVATFLLTVFFDLVIAIEVGRCARRHAFHEAYGRNRRCDRMEIPG